MCDNNCHECNECRPPTSNQTAALAYIKGKDALGCNKYDGVVSVVQDGVQGLPTGNVINEGDTISIIGADGLQHLVTLPISGVQTEIIDCSDVAACQVILNLITADAVLATRIEDLEDTFCTRVAACIDATLCSRVQTCMQPIIDTLTSRLATAETDIDALQAFVANICANIATCLVPINNTLTAHQAFIDNICTNIAPCLVPINTTLTDLVDNFCTKVAACSVVVNLQNAVTALTTRVTNAEATLAAHQAFIDNICTNITSCLVPLTNRVTDVEQDLATIYIETERGTAFSTQKHNLNPVVDDILTDPFSVTINNVENAPITVSLEAIHRYRVVMGSQTNAFWSIESNVSLEVSYDSGLTWIINHVPGHRIDLETAGVTLNSLSYPIFLGTINIPVGGSTTIMLRQRLNTLFKYGVLGDLTYDYTQINLNWSYPIIRHVP